jgi:hypothetical protein
VTFAAMTNEHLSAILAAADAKAGGDGWSNVDGDRTLTLYVSSGNTSLNVARIEGIRREGELVYARGQRGEVFVLAIEDIYAGSVEAPKAQSRAAGFGSR